MGEFLSISGIVSCKSSEVEQALAAYASKHGGKFSREVGDAEENVLGICEGEAGVTVLYPYEFFDWDEVSAEMSRALKKPVFSLHIHDGDLWMFILFVDGESVSQFNPVPDYWKKLKSQQERDLWKGDARQVAQFVPSIKPESIERYFVPWSFGDRVSAKSYPDDEFAIHDCWQMLDFMKRLGLAFPSDEEDGAAAEAFHFEVKSQ